MAPCVLTVDPQEYREQVRQASLFIEGRQHELITGATAARRPKEAMEFESAAKIRDQIQAVEKTLEKQRMVSHWGADRQIIFGLTGRRFYRGSGAVRAPGKADRDASIFVGGFGISR